MSYLGNSPGVSSQRTTSSYTATSNQTTFTAIGGYQLGYVDVYLNGTKLIANTDYTASNGTSVVLVTGANTGDSVDLVSYQPRGLSDGYLKAEADAKYELLASKGTANGYASLDGSAKVPSSQLPSYVDDVLEAANFAALPATGTTGIIYITLDTNYTYRWTGSTYVQVGGGSAGGSSGQVQYNNAGAFGGSANFVWDNSNVRLGIGTSSPDRPLTVYSATTAGANPWTVSQANLYDSRAMAAGVGGTLQLTGNYTTGGANALMAWIRASKRTATSGDYDGDLLLGARNGSIKFYTAATPTIDGTNQVVTIDSSGNVGIGTTSPTAKFEVSSSSAGVTAGDFVADTANKTVYVGRQSSTNADNSNFIVRNRVGTEVMKVDASTQTVKTAATISVGGATPSTSGAGITFPATQSASTDANTLDDYEEGTWSLTVTAGSGSFTSITSTAGYYTKVGNLVSVYGRIKIGTNGTAATDVRVSGLPFSSASGNTRYAGSGLEGDQVGFSLIAFILQSTNLIYLQKYDGTYPGGNSYGLDFTITYRT